MPLPRRLNVSPLSRFRDGPGRWIHPLAGPGSAPDASRSLTLTFLRCFHPMNTNTQLAPPPAGLVLAEATGSACFCGAAATVGAPPTADLPSQLKSDFIRALMAVAPCAVFDVWI